MLIASSNTIEGIQKLVNQYWYSDKYVVDPETLEISHPTRKVNVKIVKKGKKYRFEL